MTTGPARAPSEAARSPKLLPMADEPGAPVEIALSGEPITLSWYAREYLLMQLGNLETMRGVRGAFEAAGTTQPVKLSHEQKKQLLDALEYWDKTHPDGLSAMPGGFIALRDGLTDDLARADRDAEADSPAA